MSWVRDALHRLTGRRPDVLDDEIDTHLALEIEDNIARGMAPDAARDAARRAFGNATLTRERVYEMRRVGWIDRLWQDLSYAIRVLRKSPAFTIAAVLTLVVGIGANATMLDVIDRVFIRDPVGIDEPDRLVQLWLADSTRTSWQPSTSYVNYAAIRDGLHGVAAVATYTTWPQSYGVGGPDVVKVRAAQVSDSYFSLLGARSAIGTLLGPPDSDRDSTARIVLSHGFWTRRYGASPAVLGTVVRVGQSLFTIVGVAEPGFIGPDIAAVDVWMPIAVTNAWFEPDWRTNRRIYAHQILARVPPGVPISWLEERASLAWRQRPIKSRDDDFLVGMTAFPILARGNTGIPAPLFVAAVGTLIFLVACANTATLFYVRGMRRSPETAIRLALGAARRRIVGQLLAESMLVACVAAAGAAAVMAVGRPVLAATLLPEVGALEASIDPRAVLLVFVLAVVAGLVCGSAPGVRLFTYPPALWRATQQFAGGRVARKSLMAVVAGQTALVVPAVTGAALFLGSLYAVTSTDLGFNPKDVLVVETDLFFAGLFKENNRELPYRMLERVQRTPGVAKAALTSFAPVGNMVTVGFDGADGKQWSAAFRPVTVDYLALMEIPLLAGRALQQEDDRLGAAPVAVVSATLAREHWPGRQALGQCLVTGFSDCLRVVGVVADVKGQANTPSPLPVLYIPARRWPDWLESPVIVLKAEGNASALATQVRQQLSALHPNMPFVEVRSVEQLFEPFIRTWRVGAILFSLFGAIGLLVAAVGLYGIVSYVTAAQQRESAIRLALGASAGRLLSASLVRAGVAVTIGLSAGVALALAGGTAIASQLYGITPQDPRVFAAVIVTMLMTGLIAAYLPARRIKRIDPSQLLRAE